MKKIVTFAIISFFGVFLLPKTINAALYPISSLGNCRDAQECFYYCEIPANTPACWSYGKYILHKDVLGESTPNATVTTTPDDVAKTHGITFPIAELGNCASATACMQYCSLPENRQACYDFGKKKGLYKQTNEPTSSSNKEKFLEDAKTQLGCDSADACRAFCNNPDNRQKCEAFAQSEGLSHPEVANKPVPPGIFEAAQQILGCNSITACKEVCSKQENFQKCKDFANQHNLISGNKPESLQRPQNVSMTLPCSSAESCKAWCQENPEKCQYLKSHMYNNHPTFSPSYGITKPSNYPLPGGCTTQQECYTYCQSYPGQCPGFLQYKTGGSTPPPSQISPQTQENTQTP